MSEAMSAAPSSAPASTPATPSASPATGATMPTVSPGETKSEGTSTPGGSPDSVAKTAGQAQTPAEKIKEEIRKHKLKVNGKEMELDEPEVIRRAQLSESAQQKFQEASEMRKQATELLEVLKRDPAAVMKHLGLDPREFSEKFLEGALRKEMMTPEQRELQELRDFRAAQERQAQEAQMTEAQKAKQAEVAKIQQRVAQEYDTSITEALNQSNLPKTPHSVRRVAELMKSAIEKGYELDVPTAVDMVKHGYSTDIQALFGGLKGEALVKTLGDSLVKEIRQYDLHRIKQKLNPEGQTAAPQPNPAPSRQTEPTKHLSTAQWLEEVRKKAGV